MLPLWHQPLQTDLRAMAPTGCTVPRLDGSWVPTRCRGKIRNGEKKGQSCNGWAIRGGNFCNKHGGQLPNVQLNAKRTRRQIAAERSIVMYGLPRDVAPATALLEELHRTQGHVDWLHNIIVNIDSTDDLIKGMVEEVHRSGTADEANWDEERIAVAENIWVRMYFRERKHLVEVAKTIMSLGLAQQMIAITRQQAEIFDRAIQAMLVELGHDINDAPVRGAIVTALTTVRDAAIPLALPDATRKRA
jgi:hypothetical protein